MIVSFKKVAYCWRHIDVRDESIPVRECAFIAFYWSIICYL